jgi:DNA-binding CsgD family transcriptional regulator
VRVQGAVSAEQQLAHGQALAAAGHLAEAVSYLVTAARQLPTPAGAATLLVEGASLALLAYGAERALELAGEAATLARGSGGAVEVRAVTRLGDALLWCGRYDEARAAWDAAEQVVAPPDASVLCERANALLRSGRLVPSREAAYEAVVLARVAGGRLELLDALDLAFTAEVHSGRLREALLCAEQAVAATSVDRGLPFREALGLLAWVTALLGDVERCQGVLATAAEVGADLPMTAPGGFAAGLLALGQGRLDAAVEAFESKRREYSFSPLAQACGLRPFVPSLVEAYARTGRRDEASALAAQFVDGAVATGQPRLAAPALRARAVVDEDLDVIAEAHLWHEQWGNLFEEGRTYLAEGEVLRRRKQRAAAREALRAALQRFEHTGAATWAARAVVELRAAGDRDAAVVTPSAGPAALTQQEAAVVDLVGAGLSNREVAGQLFLSVKTVEGHLTSVYDKLGVRSRGQLLAVLAGRQRPS